MGLEVAEISELAALRPIQTTAVSGALATTAGGDDHDTATATDTGCVTPTTRATAGALDSDAAVDGIGCATSTSSGSVPPPQRDGAVDETVFYATPTACRTAAALDVCEFDAVDAAGNAAAVSFITPTSEESALRPAPVCPPAPRKLVPALKRKLAPLQQRLFYPVPLDLASVFKPAPPETAAAKKMRAHVVESSLPQLGT